MRIALVHDCIVHVGGAERVLESLHKLFPSAPVFTVVCDKRVARMMLPGAEIHTSFAQKLPASVRFFRTYFPIYPIAVESFDFSDFDVVISSSFAFAKGILTPLHTFHISYCHTPLRYLWSEYHFHRQTIFRHTWKRAVTDPVLSYLRMWDRLSADRVDQFVAISRTTAGRITKYYRRDSEIIYPPVQVRSIQPARSSADYYLLVTRLMPYKRVDLAIKAFNRLGHRLRVVGTGPQLAELKRLSRANIELLGSVSDSKLAESYSQCRALVFPGIEDFGIVMVEAQAYGKPVIACRGGGAAEIVLEGQTGLLFQEQTPESLIAAVQEFERTSFDPALIRQHALQFDEAEFMNRMKRLVEQKLHRISA
jgi:glycosyltransferase involved in cell wall biosynthesis